VGSIPITYRHFLPEVSLALPPAVNVWETWDMRTLILIIALVGSPSVRAEATTDQFLTEYQSASEDGRRYLDSFLKGLVAAYTWTNVSLAADGQRPMFCLNESGGQQIAHPTRILREAANNRPGIGVTPVGMALLVTLKRRWPCRGNTGPSAEKFNALDSVPTQTE